MRFHKCQMVFGIELMRTLTIGVGEEVIKIDVFIYFFHVGKLRAFNGCFHKKNTLKGLTIHRIFELKVNIFPAISNSIFQHVRRGSEIARS